MMKYKNADEREIDKFNRVSQTWWDSKGEMGTLHTLNPLRTEFVLEAFSDPNPKVLDVGCGGGILCEALAKRGAQVVGIDLSLASLDAARRHAEEYGLSIDYRYESVEEVVRKSAGSFDVVTCMEMLEHVPDPSAIVSACSRALKSGGHVLFSTINRMPKAFLFAIVGGEYILRLLPRGTHTYNKLIRPQELKSWARDNGLKFVKLASLMYNPFSRKFRVVEGKEDVNYMVHFRKP